MAKSPVLDEDTQRVLITQAIGQALVTWGRVEEELSLVFIHAIGAERDYAARAVFFSIRSFEARLNMVQSAIGPIWPPLPPDLAKEWNALYNRLRIKNKSRNEIAHAGILAYSLNGGPIEVKADPYLDVTSSRRPIEDANLKDLKQLREIAEGFIAAAIRVSAFEMEIAFHLKRIPTSLVRVNHPDPEVRDPASQRWREFATRLKPSDPSPQFDGSSD